MNVPGYGDVLFFDARRGSDFTMDAVWAGLVDRFGPLRVSDYGPCRDKHRAGIPQITGNIESDYGAERQSLCYVPTAMRDFLPIYDLRAVNEKLKRGDYSWVFIDERQETYELYLQTIARFVDVNVVVIAGHDRFWNRGVGDLYGMYGKNIRAIFMDNWRPEYDNHGGRVPWFPMSYATNFDHLWDADRRYQMLADKKYDVCFMGYNSHSDRARYIDHIEKRYSGSNNQIVLERRPNTVEIFRPKREYFKAMAQSRVCINLRGAAECGKALRFYEIPYVGSFMLSQNFGGKQVRPYLDGVHCKYFESVEELDEAIQWALENPAAREAIAYNGHHHAMRYHTAPARVDYMFECLERVV